LLRSNHDPAANRAITHVTAPAHTGDNCLGTGLKGKKLDNQIARIPKGDLHLTAVLRRERDRRRLKEYYQYRDERRDGRDGGGSKKRDVATTDDWKRG
jgi:hypothetical protein